MPTIESVPYADASWYPVGSSEEKLVRTKYPLLTADLTNIPHITTGNVRALARDVQRNYYGEGGESTTPLLFNGLNSAQLASMYQLLREAEPNLPPLIKIEGVSTVPRNWVTTLANSGRDTFNSIVKDIKSYMQLYRIATRSPQHYQRISQYPLETASWKDLLTDLYLLRNIARDRGWF